LHSRSFFAFRAKAEAEINGRFTGSIAREKEKSAAALFEAVKPAEFFGRKRKIPSLYGGPENLMLFKKPPEQLGFVGGEGNKPERPAGKHCF